MLPLGRAAMAAGLAVLLSAAGCSSGTSGPVRTYRMGDRVQLGNLVYNVIDSEWHTHLGDGATPRIPESRFFLVRLTITNGGAAEIVLPNLSVVDESGRAIEELSNGDRVPQWVGFLRGVKPAETIQGNLVFDCAPRHYKLQLRDENGGHGAVVDIPLSFAPDSPEAPVPEIPRKQ